MAESIGAGRHLLGGPAGHLLDDSDPIFLCTRDRQSPLQRVTIAALGKQNLLLVRARKGSDDFGGGRVFVRERLRLQREVNIGAFAFQNGNRLGGMLEIRQFYCDRVSAGREVRPGRERVFALGVRVDPHSDAAAVAVCLDRNPGQCLARGRDNLAGEKRRTFRGLRCAG